MPCCLLVAAGEHDNLIRDGIPSFENYILDPLVVVRSGIAFYGQEQLLHSFASLCKINIRRTAWRTPAYWPMFLIASSGSRSISFLVFTMLVWCTALGTLNGVVCLMHIIHWTWTQTRPEAPLYCSNEGTFFVSRSSRTSSLPLPEIEMRMRRGWNWNERQHDYFCF